MSNSSRNLKKANATANIPVSDSLKLSKRERVDCIGRELKKLFPDPPIPLDHKDAYTLLIAVLLSAQCTDERVNQVTPVLFSRADNPADMVELSVDEILEVVRPCGLGPQKAKAIFRLSEILLEKHGGDVPRTLAELEALPGVGHKTAQVVMAQAFGEPSFPVDTHIHRLAQRWGLTSGKSVAQTEKDLKRLFPKEEWNALHLQIIYYGRAQCTARTKCDGSGKACSLCPKMNPGRKLPRKTKKA
jgi:endonuclease-3